MSVALYMVPEREIEGFDQMVNGKALGHMSEKVMKKLCKELGVPDLMELYSADPAELEDFLEEGQKLPENLQKEAWFEPAQGLRAVRGLIKHLSARPKAIKNGAAVLEDLQGFEAVLLRLEKEKVRWYLAVDF